jgi:uncharacterized protein (TIGR02147 family)
METVTPIKQSGDFLRDVLRVRTARNPSYSLRALARDLSVSHAYLSYVISGKKQLSTRSAMEIGERLGLPADIRSSLIQSTLVEKKQRMNQRPKQTPLSFEELRLEHFALLSEWYHLPLFDLLEVKDFRPDHKWIAKQLGIRTSQVVSAVKRFERLGLLRVENGKWTKLQKNIAIWPNVSTKAIRTYHRNMIGKAAKTLNYSDRRSFSQRSISAITIPTDPAKLEGAKERIKRFRHSLLRYLSEGNPTRVYQLNLQLFPISKGSNRLNKGKKK